MNLLPIASATQVREYARRLGRDHRRPLTSMLVLYGLAAVVGLAGPWVLGDLVQDLYDHTLTTSVADRLVGILFAAAVLQSVLTFMSRRRSYVLGETVFARLREEFLHNVLSLPLSSVERAGTGDLLSRTTNDMDSLSRTVRFAAPEWLVALVTAAIYLGAMVVRCPLATVAVVVVVPILYLSTRRYLRYAPAGYLRERAAYATMSGTVA